MNGGKIFKHVARSPSIGSLFGASFSNELLSSLHTPLASVTPDRIGRLVRADCSSDAASESKHSHEQCFVSRCFDF